MNDWESWHPDQNTATEEVTEAVLDEHEQHATALPPEPDAASPQPAAEVEQVQQPPQQPQVEELRELNLAIEIYPEVAANYLLRAELYVQQQAWALAEDDFKTALRLANEQLEESAWGIAEQGILDAALRGLQQLKNYW